MKATQITGILTSLVMLSGAFTYTYSAAAEEDNYAGQVNGGYVQLFTPDYEEPSCEEAAPVLGASSLPSSYDLRDEGCVTAVKNQGAEGMCHAFAAIGACESNLLKQGLVTDPDLLDLSEAHLGYFLYTLQSDPLDQCYGDYLDAAGKGATGGNGIFAMAALAGGLGTQLEEYCTYSSWSTGYSDYNRYTGRYRLKTMELIALSSDTSIDAIKEWIMESGGVGFAFYSQRSRYYDNGTSYAYYAPDKTFLEDANHSAMIVGWDDDYSTENFPEDSRPSHNGAWLIKNSYGVDYFDDGYFWISYDDPTMGAYCRYILEEASAYDDVYEYDGAGYIYGYSYDKTANVFTAEYDCTLTDVSFYIPSANPSSTTYKAEVYLLNKNTDDPTDGTRKESVSVKSSYSGYRKLSLNKPVELSEGQQFSIVLSASCPVKETPLYLPIEENVQVASGFMMECHADKGESYALTNNHWFDIAGTEGNSGILGNAPIKAFTVRKEQREPLQLKAAVAAAETSGIADDTLEKAVAEGKEALNNGAGYRECSYTALTILSILESCGAVSYPEYLYEDYGVIPGDSNNDGTVELHDAADVLSAYAAEGSGMTYRLRKSQIIGMDAVQDGVLSIDDAAEILTIYAENAAGVQ